jgi:hypothetical protein
MTITSDVVAPTLIYVLRATIGCKIIANQARTNVPSITKDLVLL